MNTNRACPAHHPDNRLARPCLPTIANILRRRTTGGQGTNRARGASDCGAAMGVAAPRYAPGLRPAKRSAQPLTNSGVARHQAHDGRFLPELAGAVRAVPASFGSLQHRHSPPPFHATEPENRRPCPDF